MTKPRGINAMSPADRLKTQKAGGRAISADRKHMAEIGRKGGLSISQNKEHMTAIGRLGGAASHGKKRTHDAD